MEPPITPDQVRVLVGERATEAEVQSLIDWYTSMRQAVDAFPARDLKWVEPPPRP
jgi:hypothetical protein